MHNVTHTIAADHHTFACVAAPPLPRRKLPSGPDAVLCGGGWERDVRLWTQFACQRLCWSIAAVQGYYALPFILQEYDINIRVYPTLDEAAAATRSGERQGGGRQEGGQLALATDSWMLVSKQYCQAALVSDRGMSATARALAFCC